MINISSVGSPLQVLNHPFKVSGIVENGKGARVFIPARYGPGYDASGFRDDVLHQTARQVTDQGCR